MKESLNSNKIENKQDLKEKYKNKTNAQGYLMISDFLQEFNGKNISEVVNLIINDQDKRYAEFKLDKDLNFRIKHDKPENLKININYLEGFIKKIKQDLGLIKVEQVKKEEESKEEKKEIDEVDNSEVKRESNVENDVEDIFNEFEEEDYKNKIYGEYQVDDYNSDHTYPLRKESGNLDTIEENLTDDEKIENDFVKPYSEHGDAYHDKDVHRNGKYGPYTLKKVELDNEKEEYNNPEDDQYERETDEIRINKLQDEIEEAKNKKSNLKK